VHKINIQNYKANYTKQKDNSEQSKRYEIRTKLRAMKSRYLGN